MNSRKILAATCLTCVLCIILSAPALAKRISPAEVAPVIYDGVKFTAPHDKIGYVVAFDEKTDEQLWEVKVYDVVITSSLEEDVQRVFIKELRVSGSILIITNESNNTYKMDITNPRSPGNPELTSESSSSVPVSATNPAPRPEPAPESASAPVESAPSSSQAQGMVSLFPILIVLVLAGGIAYYIFLRKK